MELREYMSIRRAYNLVRQDAPSSTRITFEEFAIVCHLSFLGTSLKTSEIAKYQGVLRPTMTHRTNHLDSLGLIVREEGTEDRRNVCCTISEEGESLAHLLAEESCSNILPGQPLHRATAERVMHYVDAMGEVFLTAGDLVLLALDSDGDPDGLSVTTLVGILGFLQPTVSMSVSNLVKMGLAERTMRDGNLRRNSFVALTSDGRARAREITTLIDGLIVRRARRTEPELVVEA